MTATQDSVLAPTLSSRYYTDSAVFEAENQHIFERQWYYVGRADDIPAPGRILRRQVGRESVILVRGRDQVVRGFLNVCRHRGAQLCLTDTGDVGKAIRCPYHAWTYGLDGKLLAAPNWEAMESMDREEYGLHTVHVEQWEGLLWVNLAPSPTPLIDQLRPQIEARLADYSKFERYRLGDLKVGGRVEYEVVANWKLIYENFQECYHCGTIHPELVRTIPEFQSPAMGTGGYDPTGYAIAGDLESFSLTGRTVLPRLPHLLPEDDRLYYGMVVRPNCFISLVSDHVIVHRFEPVAPDRTRAVCEWLFPADVVDSGDYQVDDAVALFSKVNEQDFAAAEWCQPNMSSRAYREGGVLVPSEQTQIGVFYQWYLSSLGDAA
ncbi:aromatic ring-hydroxylating dioxygenase subunit alpha [Streptomyces sp. NA02950]|uniref:aromatic ring-hydroxylating oxygenase subunit alpha n=1 Tax=Streptomyces sp. NA02950 TaxID=2742137 RepID=UPI001590AA77|nr:aromatic ring-hydroxylating dioxygenase subunit alpha [Streptomyces sp. NA02950]QKV97069.1 aromatic ring-hydroxylating dioxygenase subunit alpha [Streptomyces sp. NA02950]